MSKINNQTGTALTADFQENTWTFVMPNGFSVAAGEFAIMPKSKYENLLIGFNMLDEICKKRKKLKTSPDKELYEAVAFIESAI